MERLDGGGRIIEMASNLLAMASNLGEIGLLWHQRPSVNLMLLLKAP